jgi:hypothetical protein
MQTKLIVRLTLCWLMSSACDSDFGNKTSGQACTRSSQCAHGLRCREGACHSKRKPVPTTDLDATEPDAGPDGSPEGGEPLTDLRGQ